ncbi:hypothetical protein [Pontibacter sp. G13]|uniref:hypothetical protein n=1 Tax=Pontibacter sp. G13 TaxID=3074898 RepID=UPI002889AE6D|nr:hypothetical protein [Pontibacter sp. G13]WNJ19875.1 hypothetical protein RJD25_05275 [Pontibacter sp. G13]
MNMITRYWILGLLLFPWISLAQSPLISEQEPQVRTRQIRPLPTFNRTSNWLDTLTIDAANPFVDDFSYDQLEPDSFRWVTLANLFDFPLRKVGTAISPPNLGVMTFDGASRFGTPYATNIVIAGTADRLFSQYFDFSGFSPADSIYLTFYLQAGGLGNTPNPSDSFRVYFRTQNPTPNEFVQVFSVGGTSTSTDFEFYEIPILASAFFHQGFQFLFESEGSLNGEIDLWHLDQVELGLNRSTGDSVRFDASPILVANSPMRPFTAIPSMQFDAIPQLQQSFVVQTASGATTAQNATLEVELTETLSGQSLSSPFSASQSVSLLPRAVTSANFTQFAEQSLTAPANLQLEARINMLGDINPSNDTIRVSYPIDSVMAYDDGEADARFGLNKPLGFGTLFGLSEPDSLVAVWISFTPVVTFNEVLNQTFYQDGATFWLTVWDDPHPDSILAQQVGNMQIAYGELPNHFERYEFPTPVAVPDSFWVGIRQNNAIPVGVGFDLNTDGDRYTYWDSAGVWTNSNLGGTLMIRPEFYNGRPDPVSISSAKTEWTAPKLFPNPISEGLVRISCQDLPHTQYAVRLIDLQGREVWHWNAAGNSSEYQLMLPHYFTDGLYLWEHIWQSGTERRVYREKVRIQLR